MTRGEVTFVFHRHSGEGVQTTCFMNFRDPEDLESIQIKVIEAVNDFTEGKEDQFKCVTVVVDIAECDHYLTAMVVFNEEGEEWENMMGAHEMSGTIH
jgi:hypothetical protein